MRRFGCLFVTAILSSAAITSGTGLPSEVADRLESRVSLADADDFVGSYRMTLSSVVQKPNGKAREESLIEAEIVNHGDGASRRRLLRFIEDGSDVTEKNEPNSNVRNGAPRRAKVTKTTTQISPVRSVAPPVTTASAPPKLGARRWS